MQKFTKITATAAPMRIINIDTDMIIPKQFLRSIKRTGFGVNLFNDMRYDEQGNENPDFILNKEPYKNAQILVTGENFGCGSSREHAPWALLDFGISCIIAPSFADIFYNNSFKNGILPLPLPQDQVDELMNAAEAQTLITVNLESQKASIENGKSFDFEIDEFRKHSLINGLDDIGLTLEKEAYISSYESINKQEKPWL